MNTRRRMNIRNEYRIDREKMTVIHYDEHGGAYDLNAQGKPCVTKADLVEFIYELCKQGAYDEDVRQLLIDEVETDEVEMDNYELKEIPAIVVAMRIIGGLAILGGIILCIKSWPGSPSEDYTWKVVAYTPALTWLFSGIISGTLFFAGGAALFYLDNIQEGLSRILDKLGTSE